MKVMLFYPPNLTSSDSIPHVGYLLFWRVNYPPIALGYLAAYLEQVGHNVKIVDCHILNYGKEDIKREIKSFDPDVVGVTVNTQRVYYAMDIVKIAKEHNPNCLTVFGGPHVTYMSRETLDECPSLDVVIRGEGEITFTELLDKNRQGWEKVRGITFRSNGKIVSTDDRPFIEDLDSLPFPAYHLMPMEKYTVEGYLKKSWINGQRFAGILTSRGCPYNCAFCASKTLGINGGIIVLKT